MQKRNSSDSFMKVPEFNMHSQHGKWLSDLLLARTATGAQVATAFINKWNILG